MEDYLTLIDNPEINDLIKGDIWDIKASDDNKLIFITQGPKIVLLKVSEDGKFEKHQVLTLHKDNVESLAYNTEKQMLVVGSADSFVSIWFIKEGTDKFAAHQILNQHQDVVNRVILTPELDIVSCSDEGRVLVFKKSESEDDSNKYVLDSEFENIEEVNSVQYLTETKEIVFCSMGLLKILAKNENGEYKLKSEFDTGSDCLEYLHYTQSNNQLLAVDGEGNMKVFKVGGELEKIGEFSIHEGCIYHMLPLEHENLVLTVGEDLTLIVGKLGVEDGQATYKEIFSVLLDSEMNCMHFDKENMLLMAGGDDGSALQWKVSKSIFEA